MVFGSTFGRVISPTFAPKSQAIEAGGWLPTDIAGCKLWLDFADKSKLFTDAGSTKVTSDGDLIYQANDKSGNNLHVAQSDTNRRPLYKTSIKNGLSAALLDGSDVWMRANTTLSALVGASDITVFSVVYFDLTKPSQTMYNVQAPDNTNRITWHPAYSGTEYFDHGATGSGGRISGKSGIASSGWYLVGCLRDGSSGRTYVNGGLNISGTFTDDLDTTQSGTLYIASGTGGSDGIFKGYMAEMIVYNVGLDDTDRVTVEAYLNAKWNIY